MAQVNEAMMMLNLFNGWPANRQATVAITDLCQALFATNEFAYVD